MPLSRREPELHELMDDPDCDINGLRNTYRQFKIINNFLSRWYQVYKDYIRPVMNKSSVNTMLDIGFGGGDIPQKISEWAQNDGYKLKITAIEMDQRAVDFANSAYNNPNVTYLKAHTSEFIDQGKRFDVVISNHLLHHLSESEIQTILKETDQLCKGIALYNDIERNSIGYLMFRLVTPLFFRNSFITYDGSISIRRSFQKKELERLVPDLWNVSRIIPFRLLLHKSYND